MLKCLKQVVALARANMKGLGMTPAALFELGAVERPPGGREGGLAHWELVHALSLIGVRQTLFSVESPDYNRNA